jgi:2-polyprenyl-3-methyl-5-hydroxy-6-metoxy-1,4-benzoquinol methylase
VELPHFNQDWPASWKLSHQYDQREIGVDFSRLGYRYAYQLRMAKLLDAVERNVPTGASVIDVGAGQGTLSLRLAEAGYKVTWNDYREELVGYVQLKYQRGDISYEPGDIFKKTGVGLFDAVVAAEVIEHVAHPDELLLSLSTLVEANGTIVVSTPNGANIFNKLPSYFEIQDPSALEGIQFQPDSDGHLFLLLPSELITLATRAGLTVCSIELVQTHAAYAVAKIAPALMRYPRVISALQALDSFLVRLPWLGKKLAVQLVAVLKKGPD